METPDPDIQAVLAESPFESPGAFFRSLVERVPAVVYIDSDEQRPDSLYLSPQTEALFGYPATTYLANPELWRENTHPEDRSLVAERWRRSRATGETFECEYRVRHGDGRWLWVHDDAVPVRGDDGAVRFWQGVLYDVTARKGAERAVREAESKYRALVENLPAVVYLVAPDDDRRTLYVSPQVERALGYPRGEWLEQPDIWMELLHPDDREPTLAAHDRANETGEPWSREYRLIAADGRAVWFRDVATLIRDEQGRPLHWQGVQLDITELKRAEEELRAARDDLEFRVLLRTHELEETNEMMAMEIAERRSAEEELREAEQKYRLLAEQIPAVTYVWEIGQAPDAIVYVSPQIERLLGFSAEEWRTAELWESRLHPDDRARVIAASIRSETTGEPFSFEYRLLAKDGRVVWVLDEATLLERDAQGTKTFQGVLIDITDRKEAEAKATRAEAKARAAEARCRILVEQIPAVTFIEIATPGELTTNRLAFISPQIEDIIGYTPEELTGDHRSFARMLHPDDRDRVLAANEHAERTAEPFDQEFRVLSKDGRLIWMHTRAVQVTDESGSEPRYWHGVTMDITSRKEAEASAQAAESKATMAEARYRTLVEQIPAMTYIETSSPNEPYSSHLTFVSPQSESILGYTPQELIDDPGYFARILHPDDRDRVLAANDHAGRTSEPFDQEYRAVNKDGRVVWMHSRAVLVTDESGSPPFWHGVALDITERKEAEANLREMEDRFRDVLVRLQSRPNA